MCNLFLKKEKNEKPKFKPCTLDGDVNVFGKTSSFTAFENVAHKWEEKKQMWFNKKVKGEGRILS